MIIGCPKEMKAGETRVALTPEWTRTLVLGAPSREEGNGRRRRSPH